MGNRPIPIRQPSEGALNVRLPGDVLAWIAREAEREGRSRSDVVRRALVRQMEMDR